MITICQTGDPMRRHRTRAWTIAVMFAITLAYASSANALPPDRNPGDDPGPQPEPESCFPAATGRISASPATVLLRPGESPETTLSWSTTITRDCPSLRFEISNRAVVADGSMVKSFTTPGAYRYTLKMRTSTLNPKTVATTVVEVKALFPVTLSEGRQITTWDIQQFDDRWMYAPLLDLGGVKWGLQAHYLPVGWEHSERMRAMVRLYEITHERRYLDHLSDMIEIVLQYRDDRHPTERHLDEFRPDRSTPMPAWGWSAPSNAWHWRTSPVIAALYSYPIAAFARIIAENPDLQAEYGERALSYANAVLETFEAYYPDWRSQGNGTSRQMYMVSPDTARTLLTQEKCDRAYQEALTMNPRPWDTPNRLKTFHQQCLDGAKYEASPEPHNITHEFVMMAIELFRAIDSDFYRQSTEYRWTASLARKLIVSLVTSHQRFFVDALRTTHERGYSEDPPVNPNLPIPYTTPPRFVWDYMENSFRPHIEDPSHGALSMSYIGLLRDNQALLDARRGPDDGPIPLTSEYLDKFANTFLHNVTSGDHFRHDVAGRIKDNRSEDEYDDRCEGWLQLARANPLVYERCAAITLREVNGLQPKLNIGNHSELLWTKQFR